MRIESYAAFGCIFGPVHAAGFSSVEFGDDYYERIDALEGIDGLHRQRKPDRCCSEVSRLMQRTFNNTTFVSRFFQFVYACRSCYQGNGWHSTGCNWDDLRLAALDL